MQKHPTPTEGEGASLSRRNFITMAAASTAATLPSVALAEASGKTSRLPLPLDQQFDICVANLRNVLMAMHPEVIQIEVDYHPFNHGRNFSLVMIGHRPRRGGAR
ncbi:secreted protein [Neorhizobium sp. R1-B]|uniref:twin-arginine translocation signal domain-containing protein n=1 Tax=Neorhizobium sp. R1-B TaxID=2485162 RepID=UPI0010666A95|nr:twin-arginine translocation signal domain-containing protein [Neorhizobium sp. R1-B]TDX77745.1 secreted protein [Neorhizobium sp. R1-B]